MDSHRDAFLDLLGRHIHLIKSRSQAFEDGHVTVYDKTLLSLSRNGKDVSRPAVVQYYCEEFLSLSPEATPAETGRLLRQEVGIPKALTRGKLRKIVDCPVSLADPLYSDRSSEMTSTDARNIVRSESKPNTFPASPRKDMEPKLARLWGVYETAREDYLAVADKNNDDAMNAARFLRDTAENTLGYLENKNVDPIMLAELNGTYQMAKATAVSLAGGKKRKFDPVDMDDVKGTPRAPSNFGRRSRPRRHGGANRHDPLPSSDSGYGAMRHPYGSVSPSSEMMPTGYNSRATDTYPYPPASASPRSRDPPSMADSQRPRGYGRAPIPMRGRGHGTVPYGYSREVDSYHPGDRAWGA